MHDVRGGDRIGAGVDGGSGAWWGFAFIVFIIFAIIISFSFLHGRNREDGGWEKMLPLLGLMKGKFGGEDHDCRHTELIKDQAKDTGKIIHNQDQKAYDLKASMDNQTRFIEKSIENIEKDRLKEALACIRAELSDCRTHGSFESLHKEIKGIKETCCAPGWFAASVR